jgi:hypothetical protein
MTCPCPKHPFGCYGHPHRCGCSKPSREAREKEITRLATIEECAQLLETSYPDHAWLNAACAAIRSLSLTRPDRGGVA